MKYLALLTAALGIATNVLMEVTSEPVHEDVSVVLNITVEEGINPGGVSWSDSYSIGDRCYCRTTFDHNIGDYHVETPFGWLTTRQICELLGPGPGLVSNPPVYNDVQCGNGPPNDAGDEHVCPGRVDIGREGCGHIGPTWNFAADVPPETPVVLPFLPADAHPDIVAVLNITAGVDPTMDMASSYSVDGRCYCMPTLENGIGPFFVQTELGWKTVQETCDLVGQGPQEGRIYYNDVQCGHGPPSAAGDEQACPGRVDIGADGCRHIGPTWSFETQRPTISPTSSSPTHGPSLVPMLPEMPSSVPSVVRSFSPTSLPVTSSSEVPSPVPSSSRNTTPSDEGALPQLSSIPSDLPSSMPSEPPASSATPSTLRPTNVPSIDPTNATVAQSPGSSTFQAGPTSSGRRQRSTALAAAVFIFHIAYVITSNLVP